MRVVFGFGHAIVMALAVIGMIYWYEIERIHYCGLTPPQRCEIFSFGISFFALSIAYGVGLYCLAAPRIIIALRANLNQPAGHAAFLIKLIPTGLFVAVLLYISNGRAGQNDVEWLSILGTFVMFGIGARGMITISANKPLAMGPAWLISVIGLLILAAMAGFTLFVMQNQSLLFHNR